MPYTANDLARGIGLELGIIDAVTDLEADALTDLTEWSRQKHAELRVRHFCNWDENDIPDEVAHPLKLYLASCFGKNFGKTVRDEPLSEAQTREARLAQLLTIVAMPYSGSVATNEYF